MLIEVQGKISFTKQNNSGGGVIPRQEEVW
jgi:hypothetical protein